ncbi:MAG: Holliday junction resolvase RuvX, partial [Polyangiales bacterium]
VVGLPLRLDGSEGESARRARVFGDALGIALAVEVVYWDERMTTVAAERSLREMGRHGARRREVVDQSAATILLQSYLEAKTGGAWKDPSG